jgi:alpha-methylacyl-CoA racemase
MTVPRGGPLAGIRVVEVGGLGAVPYGCMMLADMGADVVRIERQGGGAEIPANSPLLRNRRSLVMDLKKPQAVDFTLALIERADVLVEGFRPGAAERLGIGPEICLQRNPRLVYARLTGWGQTGPMSQRAGHDLNYIGVAGLLHQIGPLGGDPVVPLNVIGDFGGGGLLMAFGVACALFETQRSGKGQIIDAAMIDGALSFMAMFFGDRAAGTFPDRTGAHLLGGAAHYYNIYRTSDGKHLSVAPIEPQFYREFVAKLGVDPNRFLPAGYPNEDYAIVTHDWSALKSELQTIFKLRTRDAWVALFEDSDVCVTPVLTLAEAMQHPHNRARGSFLDIQGVQQQAPAPRFSRTVPSKPTASAVVGAESDAVAREWGLEPALIEHARAAGAMD